MNRLLDPAAAAEHLGVSVATLADWRYRRRGPAYVKVERLVRYRPEDLESYVEASTTEPSEPR
jgi:DNA-binding transcriptional regulator YiaG